MSVRPAEPIAQDPPIVFDPWPLWLSRIASDLKAYKAKTIRPKREAA